MDVIVCGGRNFGRAGAGRALSVAARETEYLHQQLSALHDQYGFTKVHHGDAQGADRRAGQWARRRGVAVQSWPADWAGHGRGAGMRRNLDMLWGSGARLVVAFPGGRGTAHMVRVARAAGVQVIELPGPHAPTV